MRTRHYLETLDYLYSFADCEAKPSLRAADNFDLRRVEELLARLGGPQHTARAIHIAGTKGKGSTAAMVASVLVAAGFKTGLYTSPHLIDVRERIRIDGRLISQADIARLTDVLRPEVAAVNAQARYGTLTTFELLTVLGFMYFAEKQADWQVVEVGLGGRLDATNVVSPAVCIISTISLDHTDVLGDTIAKIAAEKAGIIKEGIPVVIAAQPPEGHDVISRTCQAKRSQLIEVGRDIICRGAGIFSGRQRCEVKGRLGSYVFELPLLGAFQQANAALAVGALEVLMEQGHRLSSLDIVFGLRHVRWPGRFQVVHRCPIIVVDGAHNSAAAAELVRAIEIYSAGMASKVLVIGISADKDYQGFAEVLAPFFDVVVATHTTNPRALDAAVLAEVCRNHVRDVYTAPSVANALDLAVRLAGANGFICASGSLFVVGEALRWAGRPGY
ncbi:MAG: bifunctional folylpolyglutamate synthase/dihydrofolate synthase [Dehalococcoidia bacterium]|nr:bifunctional folylpolyglutamate synthase/dihydrofolate synthase [Dehalococcoidia bacterium]